ncbi:MGMT family protein [Glycomyces harbinensis]|uniref:Alkylated DNA nucleotide flippase Atl1, participates in nucleotide excision repair, Ada-like DNA-binding domain n=1 Tax=Glycomyces harbinensis TaxID=58114 RepID=A0A1G6X761_9ACTN|nr:MGMT family protein [Glycomyces harbinensis]SDD74001.1 Alkylated DNA nucleotide flippase Atl1, participates in nucleotide excision repair, Ada-like DNA-binding domain [Glycomyces harbinensis]
MTTERDWELVRRVVDALPEGTWTSYGDLAELIGTGPRQVGAFMKDDGGVAKAYRVLTAGGTVSEGFRWSDGRSGRDVPDLLRDDGVTVSAKGRADRSQRMSVYDLKLLAAELDDGPGVEGDDFEDEFEGDFDRD